jgi:hypothetical protein
MAALQLHFWSDLRCDEAYTIVLLWRHLVAVGESESLIQDQPGKDHS